jgi:glutamate racemase
MKIGVFDSGIGGLSVAQAIELALPDAEILFRHDTPDHFPYATKGPEEIYGYAVPVIQSLVDDGCQVIVIACNTVSTTLSGRLRDHFKVPIVALDPMVKPAAEQTITGVIAVCATPTTLKSERYQTLKDEFAQNITVLEPDCADWSALIERNQMNEQRLRKEIEPVLQVGADVIVLACTHYHWIEEKIKKLAAGRATVLQPEQPVIGQLKRVIATL